MATSFCSISPVAIWIIRLVVSVRSSSATFIDSTEKAAAALTALLVVTIWSRAASTSLAFPSATCLQAYARAEKARPRTKKTATATRGSIMGGSLLLPPRDPVGPVVGGEVFQTGLVD